MNVSEKLVGMYDQYISSKTELQKTYYRQNEFWDKINKDSPSDLSLKSVEGYGNKHELSVLLAHLPPEVIFREFGKDILIWTWMNYSYEDKNLFESMGKLTGNNIEVMEMARLFAWRCLTSNYDVKTVNAIHDMNQNITNGIANSIDLKTIFRNNAKDQIEMSDKRLKEYSFMPLVPEKNGLYGYVANWRYNESIKEDRSYSIYLDAPMGLALMYKGEPNAMIGFCPNDVDTIMIYQIQGIVGKRKPDEKEIISSRGLVPINWKNFLVDVVKEIGLKLNYSKIGIQSGQYNIWANPNNGIGGQHLLMENALKLYDQFAEKLGFEQAENCNWYKSIK